ncbi:hypothetical protein OS493_025499 [Desmophyllum pertusum]|uniref:Uncharacterized protein n=1 Tax=Desmophyllum pertusum TaxID=174260 RepID=A0A9W9YLD1_9CNID|nr:hypothetical protein OS493_025499 [Desmophyllum pertusum]
MKALLLVLFFVPFVLSHPRHNKLTNHTAEPKGPQQFTESEQKTIKCPKREDVSAVRDMSASKRAGPLAAVLANPKVQEAVVEKGIEVAGKLVDKQLQIIDDAQQKAADFLKKEVREDEL